MDNNAIDIVLTWVDGSDAEWLKDREKYLHEHEYPENATESYRFRSWNNLEFLFRGIEQFMPWVNKVFLVTCGRFPDFINDNCHKLVKVRHDEYIPKKYLPTFNARTINLNVHRIKELSENFILFDDDTFPLTKIDEDYYFRNNKVCDQAIQTVLIQSPGNGLYFMNHSNNIREINRFFNKREVISQNYNKWFCNEYRKEDIERNIALEYWEKFTGFRNIHMPLAYKKSTFEKVWNKNFEVLDRTCQNRFRSYTDVNHYLMRYWQLCEGDFHPRKSIGKLIRVGIESVTDAVDIIENQREPLICLGDQHIATEEAFREACEDIRKAFFKILPDKSCFEI